MSEFYFVGTCENCHAHLLLQLADADLTGPTATPEEQLRDLPCVCGDGAWDARTISSEEYLALFHAQQQTEDRVIDLRALERDRLGLGSRRR